MAVEALDAAVTGDNQGNWFAVRIHKSARHRLLADSKLARHGNDGFEGDAGSPDKLPNALVRHQQVRRKCVRFAFDPPPAILAARIEQMQIAELTLHGMTGGRLVRFDQEVTQFMGKRKSSSGSGAVAIDEDESG